MSFKRRLERLEGRRGSELCASCGGRIIYEEHHEDGTVSYPEGDEPCLECSNSPQRGIGKIEVLTQAGV